MYIFPYYSYPWPFVSSHAQTDHDLRFGIKIDGQSGARRVLPIKDALFRACHIMHNVILIYDYRAKAIRESEIETSTDVIN